MITEFKLPELGENIETANVVKILVSVGDTIEKDQPVLELETDKASVELPSSVGGVVKEIHVLEGSKAKVGQVVLTVESGAVEEPKRKQEPVEKPVIAVPEKVVTEAPLAVEEPQQIGKADQVISFPARIAPASPSVRRLAREIGIDIHDVSGSGPGGRITTDDVKKHARRLHTEMRKSAAEAPSAAPDLPDFSKWGEVDRKPMSNVRLKTAEHMSLAWTNIPHVTQFDKADVTELEEQRKRFGSKVEAAGGKLTVTAILLRVVSSALKVFPQLNACIDVGRNEIVYKKYYHIGVAVDTDRGLLVPVIRDVDKKNILQLSVELTHVAERARNKKITLEEMQGGTFTITNLGGVGGAYFTPIVNFPEVAILGVSRTGMEPVYVNGQFEPRAMLPLSLSYDHRLIDGADAARFLRWVCEALRDPFVMALEG